MGNRYRYTGETPAILREHNTWTNYHFEFELAPGDEFDAPAGWRPEPYPHPLYDHLDAKPVETDEASPHQESEEA